MGTQQSNDGAAICFGSIGGDLQGLAFGAINIINAPAQIMTSLAKFLSSFVSGITLLIIIIGVLYL